MSEVELRELSLRARLAQLRNDSISAFMPSRVALVFDDYRIWSSGTRIVMINHHGNQFFWHNTTNDIECTNDEWAKALLVKLRTVQILDQMADV